MLGTRIALLKDGAIDVLATPEEFLRAQTKEACAFLAGLERNRGDTMFPEILALTLEHLKLVAITVAIAAAFGIPGAAMLARHPAGRRWALWFANVGQTIPSLALFGFLIPVPLIGGIGQRTAIVALCLYALLPILRNSLTGILGVDAAVRESAVAMGMTARQISGRWNCRWRRLRSWPGCASQR